MSLPSKIKLGPYTFEVIEVVNLKDEKGVSCWGVCEHKLHKIFVDVDAPVDRKKVILIHELLHSTWELSGLPKRAEEEDFCTRVAPIVSQLLKENPELVKYVVGE